MVKPNYYAIVRTMAAVLAGIGLPLLASAAPAEQAAEASVAVSPEPCSNQLTPGDNANMAQMRELLLDTNAKKDRLVAMFRSPNAKGYMERAALRQHSDWADLCHYRAANAEIRAHTAPVVVFMGDSITENWAVADRALFANGVVGRGVSGQTSSQMLLRFYSDVIALKPKVVHIMAGTNDVAANTGPISDEDFENNIRAMVELAQADKIAVVLASIPPSSGMARVPGLRPAARITALNTWLRAYASERNAIYVDYDSVLNDGNGGLRANLSNDGVHPNRAGYAAMVASTNRAIAQAAPVQAGQ